MRRSCIAAIGAALAACAGLAPLAFGQDKTTPTVTRPRWISQPSGGDVDKYFPKRAQLDERSGLVRMACTVTADGRLSACRIEEETPVDFGFGEAALAMAPLFRMAPETNDGQPVSGATVVVPISFRIDGTPYPTPAPSGGPVWLRKPLAEDVRAVFPKAALAKAQAGSVKLHCRIDAKGALTACKVVDEQPAKLGFGEAGLKLSRLYAMEPKTSSGASVAGAEIEIQITLPLE